MIHPAPKPPPTPKKTPVPLRRTASLKPGTTRLQSTTPLKAINPVKKAQRAVTQRTHYASKEYKAAKGIAEARAKGRCEAWHVLDSSGRLIAQLLPGEAQKKPRGGEILRCPNVDRLQFHETDYGSDLGILREIDGFILCEGDHGYLERTRHPTRTHGR